MGKRFNDDELNRIREDIRLVCEDIGKVVRGLCSKYGIEIKESDEQFMVSHIVLLYTLSRSLVELVSVIEGVDKKKEINEYCSKIDIGDILRGFLNKEYGSDLKSLDVN